MSSKVQKYVKEYEDAAKRLVQAVKESFPVGCVVCVKIGRSAFEAEILSHNECWWSTPGEMTGRNLKTGKTRRFTEYYILPNA